MLQIGTYRLDTHTFIAYDIDSIVFIFLHILLLVLKAIIRVRLQFAH